MIDCHIHSKFSFDSCADSEDMVKQAIQVGLSVVTFTEHKDLEPTYEFLNYYKDKPYTENIERLREKFSKDIKVLKGVELDFQSYTKGDFVEFTKRYQFDFVIGSVHALEHYFVDEDYFKAKNPVGVFKEYFKEVERLSMCDGFDVIGHMDYVKRYGVLFERIDYPYFEPIFVNIFKNIIERGKGIELNTSGWRHFPREPYPNLYLLNLYKRMGGEIITVGSDAHKVEDVGRDISRAIELLKEIGFKYVYYFEKRKPKKISILEYIF